MTYLSRADALTFIIEQRSPEIIQQATVKSMALSTFRTIPVGSNTLRLSMVDAFPQAQWLLPAMDDLPADDVDVANKPQTRMSWTQGDILVEEAAAIAIIPENVLDDASGEIDLMAQVEERVAEAIAVLIDQTFFFGTAPVGGVPASFPVGGLVGRCIAHAHEYEWGATTAGEDIAEAWSQTMELVEQDNFDVSDSYAARSIRGKLRTMRDANGNPLYVTNLAGGGPTDAMYGVPMHYMTNGTWDASKALALMGDPNFAVIAMRQRLTAKPLDQATLTGFGNLAEKDSIALRVKTRLGFGILVPKGLGQSADPFPFAVLAPKTSANATGAAAGSPGSFTPAGSERPVNLAGMTGVTASPATAWTATQYVATGDGSKVKWNGTAWVAA
jgi:HK97 family phage major capsid protein